MEFGGPDILFVISDVDCNWGSLYRDFTASASFFLVRCTQEMSY